MRVPLWLKIGWTVWVIAWVPFYWKQYGLQNFLECDPRAEDLVGVLALMAPLAPPYHFNPSTRYRSASMRWYPNTQVLASGVIRMGPMVSTPAGSDGMSCFQSLR
jgi:hypothetical protein